MITNIPSAVAAQTLGRPLSGGANIDVNLVRPGDRTAIASTRSTCDLPRSSASVGIRTQIALDLFNALNSNKVETYNQDFVVGRSLSASDRYTAGTVR